jgi:hypothetical protein
MGGINVKLCPAFEVGGVLETELGSHLPHCWRQIVLQSDLKTKIQLWNDEKLFGDSVSDTETA